MEYVLLQVYSAVKNSVWSVSGRLHSPQVGACMTSELAPCQDYESYRASPVSGLFPVSHVWPAGRLHLYQVRQLGWARL